MHKKHHSWLPVGCYSKKNLACVNALAVKSTPVFRRGWMAIEHLSSTALIKKASG